MKYMINLSNQEDIGSGGPSSFGSGKFGFVLLAENIQHARTKTINRAKSLNLGGWSANIVRLKESGQYDNGTTLAEIFDPEREMTMNKITRTCDDCGTNKNLRGDTNCFLCDLCRDKRIKIEKEINKKIAEFNGDTQLCDEIICPHCGFRHEDSYELADSDGEEIECDECGNKYILLVDICISYTTKKL